MKHEIRHKPDFAMLSVTLDEGEQVITETGAMMGMSPTMKMESNMKGGLMAAAKRAMSGESLFLNTYTATANGQRLDVAPASPGDMEHIAIDAGAAVIVQAGGYCACTPGVTIDSKWGGWKSFRAGEGLIMLHCSGQGDLWISSYGAIHMEEVNGTYVVDTTHIVAFDETLQFNIRGLGGLKSRFLSGEGAVVEFTGTGRVWMQTRSAPTLAEFLHPFRSVKPDSN